MRQPQEFSPEQGVKRLVSALGVLFVVVCAMFLAKNALDHVGWGMFVPSVMRAINAWGVVSTVTVVCLIIWLIWVARSGSFNRLSRHGSGLFRRSVADKRLFGVCGGVARYFGASSALVRVLAVLLLVALPPTTCLAYFVMAVAIPADNA